MAKFEIKIVAITQDEYDNLLESKNKLNCLECCGVDNWEGYSDAMEMLDMIEEGE